MADSNFAPTRSNLLSLRRQLAFAEEGYDLLEQKRQILILELMNRLQRADQVEREVTELWPRAQASLREAALDGGSKTLDEAALGARLHPPLNVTAQHLMGLKIPRITMPVPAADAPFGVGGTTANLDQARLRFVELLPKLAELAGLQNTVMRLARELRKTQRRCNALSKIFIPGYRQAIAYIAGALEERERESLAIMKMIRDRLASK